MKLQIASWCLSYYYVVIKIIVISHPPHLVNNTSLKYKKHMYGEESNKTLQTNKHVIRQYEVVKSTPAPKTHRQNSSSQPLNN
jgi:hypothetical protein